MSSIDVSRTIADMTNNTAKINAEKVMRNGGQSELDQDAFLRLLITQMRSQDPLNPMDSNQFLAQQAQFTQISELQKLNKTMMASNQMMQASSLIGKQVAISDPNNIDNVISGTVNEAKVTAKGASIVVNGQDYPLDSIVSIKAAQNK